MRHTDHMTVVAEVPWETIVGAARIGADTVPDEKLTREHAEDLRNAAARIDVRLGWMERTNA